MNSPKRIARIAGVLYLLVIGVKTLKPENPSPSRLRCRVPELEETSRQLQ